MWTKQKSLRIILSQDSFFKDQIFPTFLKVNTLMCLLCLTPISSYCWFMGACLIHGQIVPVSDAFHLQPALMLPHISCWWLLKSKPALHPSTANAVSLLDLVHLFTRQQNTHKHPWHSPVVEKYDSNNLGFQAGTEWYIYIPEERTLEMITASRCHMTYLIWMMLARTGIKMCFVILFGFVMMKTTKVTIRW